MARRGTTHPCLSPPRKRERDSGNKMARGRPWDSAYHRMLQYDAAVLHPRTKCLLPQLRGLRLSLNIVGGAQAGKAVTATMMPGYLRCIQVENAPVVQGCEKVVKGRLGKELVGSRAKLCAHAKPRLARWELRRIDVAELSSDSHTALRALLRRLLVRLI